MWNGILTNFYLIFSRFKALDRLDADRKLMLFQHLGFVHCPIREHCPAFPNCMDSIVERIVAKKAHNSSGSTRPSSWTNVGDNNHLNLVMLGSDNLTHTMERQVRSVCNSDDEFMLNDEEVFSLDYRCVSGDVSLPENAFRTQDFLPHGKLPKKSGKVFRLFSFWRICLKKIICTIFWEIDFLIVKKSWNFVYFEAGKYELGSFWRYFCDGKSTWWDFIPVLQTLCHL